MACPPPRREALSRTAESCRAFRLIDFRPALQSAPMLAELTENSSIIVEAIAVPVLFIVAVALARFLKRRAGVELGLRYQLFCIAFSFWLPLEVIGADFPQHDGVMRALRAATLLLGTFFVLA